MTSYPKVIERPYKVLIGKTEYIEDVLGEEDTYFVVGYEYNRSFRLESDAEAYAERMSEDYEFVKIEKKENH